MLISYYANKKSSPRLPSWQPSLISFNTPIDSGSIIKPCTLKHFQVPILAPGLVDGWHSISKDRVLSHSCRVLSSSKNITENFISYLSVGEFLNNSSSVDKTVNCTVNQTLGAAKCNPTRRNCCRPVVQRQMPTFFDFLRRLAATSTRATFY